MQKEKERKQCLSLSMRINGHVKWWKEKKWSIFLVIQDGKEKEKRRTGYLFVPNGVFFLSRMPLRVSQFPSLSHYFLQVYSLHWILWSKDSFFFWLNSSKDSKTWLCGFFSHKFFPPRIGIFVVWFWSICGGQLGLVIANVFLDKH